MKIIIFGLTLCAFVYATENCNCTKEFQPLCASNGNTYNNECEFDCAAKSDDTLEIIGEGECEKSCICPEFWTPVCGTDGRTYSNECKLACEMKENPHLKQKSEGPCRCPCNRRLRPVCGSNGVTYRNACMLECANKNSNVTIASRGKCI